MGIMKPCCTSSPYSIENSNPDPNKFNIIYSWEINENLIIFVNYPNCKNFEGNKLLVYKKIKNVSILLSMVNNKLDPHFDKNNICPIARFIPTNEGLELAIKLCNIIGD